MSNAKNFIKSIAAYAQQVANANKLYASVMIAQACLESGYGNSALSDPPNHNLFGIKGDYNGQSVTLRTAEQTSTGAVYYVNAAFRKYPSYKQSLEDNAKLLRNGLTWNTSFYSGTWKEKAKTYKDATAWLQGRYATDVRYAAKLNAIIAEHNLTQYDTGTAAPAPTPTAPVVVSDSNKRLFLDATNVTWRVYHKNGPYVSGTEVGKLAPKANNGLLYKVVRELGNGLYIIKTQDFGEVAIFVPAGDKTSALINGKTIMLSAKVPLWRVYKTTGPYTTGKEVAKLAPAKFGGLAYKVEKDLGNKLIQIKTADFGQVVVYADHDATII